MSYERQMLKNLQMPDQSAVEKALLLALFKHNGVVQEFSAGEHIVEEIAGRFHLNEEQREASLETIYRKENRLKKSNLWHRLLFRSADALAKRGYVSRPTQTVLLTNKREWMLTEGGYDEALGILKIPATEKESMVIKTYEVQKFVKRIKEQPKPINYNPIESKKENVVFRTVKLRERGFRQAILESYEYRCAVCGLRIQSPDYSRWEVEAAHIVPHRLNGKDDVWNGLALCRLHHWAFDVGWFSLKDDFHILPSTQLERLPETDGKMKEFDMMKNLAHSNQKIWLPANSNAYPHHTAMKWHRENVFHQSH